MVDNDENKDKQFDEIRELLKKHYKPKEELNPESLWKSVSEKIDALFHKEIFSETLCGLDGNFLTEEERYSLGLEEYINNTLSSLKHKTITDHLLSCSICRGNYNKILDKKKLVSV